jgi:predicted dehydrogenase
MDSVYRAGVIGLGVMGSIADGLGGRHPTWFPPCSHADAYRMNPRTELVAGATRSSEKASAFKAKFERPVYADYQEMLASEALDVVSVATPATLHAEMTIAAAKAGARAVFCEKVMATSLAECDEMISTCRAKGTILAINHTRRWNDRFRSIARFVAEGRIGRVEAVHTHFGGSRLCRSGSHHIDFARMVVEDDPVVWGIGSLSNPEDVDPGGWGLFETASGRRIHVDGCEGMTHTGMTDIVGEKGVVRILDGGLKVEWWHKSNDAVGGMAMGSLPDNFPIRSPLRNAVNDLLACIEHSDLTPLCSGEDGRTAFEMIAAIHLSDRAGRAVVPFPLTDVEHIIPSN